MSTRCLIGILDTKQKEYDEWVVKYVYCHFDGYPSGVGKTLYTYYNTPNKVDELCSLNSFSSLDTSIESTATSQYHDGGTPGSTMLYKEYRCTDKYGVDYVYLYLPNIEWDGGYWTVRPTFGYMLDEIAEDNSWDKY